ncbi:MAG TPA: hypothetical protein VFI46_16275 [Jiangellaceae bacterium]|nr:hypothetical protein [Jiangellaceae bacterium]
MVALAGPAAAGPPLEKEDFHDEFTEVEENFCDVEGLSVEIHGVIDGTFLFNTTGKNDLPHVMDTVHGTVSLTNLTTGKSYTDVFDGVDNTLEVTDNGDGTVTVVQLLTGGGRVLGPDGKVVFHNDGQIRLQLLIDYGGTLYDLSDDVVLIEEQIFGSTGTNDTEGHDFCEDFLAITG